MACLAGDMLCAIARGSEVLYRTRGGNGQRRMSQNGCSTGKPGGRRQKVVVVRSEGWQWNRRQPLLGLVPPSGRESVRSKTGGRRRLLYLVSVCRPTSLSRVTASPPPLSPGHGIGASGFAHLDLVLYRQTDTWCWCCRCVRSPAGGAGRNKHAVQNPRKLCSPVAACCECGVSLALVRDDGTQHDTTATRTRQHIFPGQIDTGTTPLARR